MNNSAPITVVGLGVATGTHFFPPPLSIVNSLHPQLVPLQVLETYMGM